MGTIGLGMFSEYSRSAGPVRRRRGRLSWNAPVIHVGNRRGGGITTPSLWGWARRSVRPSADAGHLLHDLLAQIPGEYQKIIGLRLHDFVGMFDGDARTGQEIALLVGAAVDGVIHKIGADAAIVEQGVALARVPVGGDGFPAAFGGDEKFQKIALLVCFTFSPKAA